MSILAGSSTVVAACGWNLSPSTPAPTPVSTPGNIPAQPTPEPEPTPTPPEPTPTPTPEPEPEPVDQIFVMARSGEDFLHSDHSDDESCLLPRINMSGLLRTSPNLEIEADWADILEPRSAGAAWIFQLRVNIDGWTSGDPVTAHDFVRTWRRLIDPAEDFRAAWLLMDIENAREIARGDLPPENLGITAVDDWTLEVRLERPRFSFPAVAASPSLVPRFGPALLQPPEEQDLVDRDRCAFNGPMRTSDDSEERLRLDPSPGHWAREEINVEHIEIVSPDSGQYLNQFRRGEIDFIRLSRADLSRVRADSALTRNLTTTLSTRITALVPRTDFPPFTDVRVRRAIGRMIDRQRLELITEGRYAPAYQFFPAGLLPAFERTDVDRQLVFDIDGALADIAETGFATPDAWPEFSLTIPDGDEYRERLAQDILDQLFENIGLVVPLEIVDSETFREGVRAGSYPLTWLEWSYRYADPGCIYADLFTSWAGSDYQFDWGDDEYDELVRLADALADGAERAEQYIACDGLLQEWAMCIPLVHPVEYVLIQPWIRNLPANRTGRVITSGPLFSRFPLGVEITNRT
jgi:oligopeptide transport system substrate-binding protein